MSDEIGSLADAEALLTQAIEADNAPVAPAPEPVVEAPAEPQVTPDQPTNTAPDLFADASIDLTNLSPAEELRIRQMQAHFTRKTQELAESQKSSAEAVAFVNALQNDPQYAMQVHQELSTALQQAGLTPAQANQAAAQQIQAETQTVPFEDDEGFGEEDYWQNEQPAPRVPPEIQQQLQELQAWKEEQTNAAQLREYTAQLDAEMQSIRSENPTYSDDDVDAVYARAFAFGGDLRAAQQAFEADRNRIITAYLQTKASVPTGQPVSSGPGATPTSFGPDLNKAHEAAMEHLRNLQAQGLA